MISEVTGVDSSYCIPDVVWNRIIPLLQAIRRKFKNSSSKEKELMIAIPKSGSEIVSASDFRGFKGTNVLLIDENTVCV